MGSSVSLVSNSGCSLSFQLTTDGASPYNYKFRIQSSQPITSRSYSLGAGCTTITGWAVTGDGPSGSYVDFGPTTAPFGSALYGDFIVGFTSDGSPLSTNLKFFLLDSNGNTSQIDSQTVS